MVSKLNVIHVLHAEHMGRESSLRCRKFQIRLCWILWNDFKSLAIIATNQTKEKDGKLTFLEKLNWPQRLSRSIPEVKKKKKIPKLDEHQCVHASTMSERISWLFEVLPKTIRNLWWQEKLKIFKILVLMTKFSLIFLVNWDIIDWKIDFNRRMLLSASTEIQRTPNLVTLWCSLCKLDKPALMFFLEGVEVKHQSFKTIGPCFSCEVTKAPGKK